MAEGALLVAGRDARRRSEYGWVRRIARRRLLARSVPPILTLLVVTWRITGPSYWRDEAATVSAVHRPLPALIRMLAHVDAVHGAYYLIMWPVAKVAGTGEIAMRLPSAVSMAATAAVITVIGARLMSERAGLAAGIVWAVLPVTSWYGQDARSYAMATTLACVATYLLLRLLDDPDHGRIAGYALAAAILGWISLFALLILPAHGLTTWLVTRRSGARLAIRKGWLAASAAATLANIPLMVFAWRQRADIEWIPALDGHEASTIAAWSGSAPVSQVSALILIAGIAFTAAGGWLALRRAFPGELVALCLPWALAPVALLASASLVMPVFQFRYVLFAVPAAALLMGAAIARLGRVAGALAAILLALVAIPCQIGDRGPAGHYDNIRYLDQVISAQAQPGDAVVYSWQGWRQAAAAYPYGLAQLDDIALAQTPVAAGNLLGTDLPTPLIARNLAGVRRVWLLQATFSPPESLLDEHGFRLVKSWWITSVWLRLYVRSAR
jgi:mannosyltransferase